MSGSMSDLPESSLNINFLRENVVKKLCELLDKAGTRGWRKLAEIANADRRVRVSEEDLDLCSLKVLDVEGSPARVLLRLMGDRGCTSSILQDLLRTMGHTEALQCLKPPGIQIMVQPVSVAVISGHNVRLSCYAMGAPGVQYQWFKLKQEVPNGACPDLVFSPARLKDAGFYICRVNCGEACEFSHWAEVDVLDVLPVYGEGFLLCCTSETVLIQPQSQRLMMGDKLHLECGAAGRPLPFYQWYKNGVPLKKATKRKLAIPFSTCEDQGRYRCEITYNNERTWSTEVDVYVGTTTFLGAVECSEGIDSYATDKVALLIGNMSYKSHPQLKAPLVDVYDLTNLLGQLNFKVVSLLDLTESEMRNAVAEFLSLLHKGVYGLLYYAGHGYENFGNSFMVPVDAPNPYRSANCLCVQSILKLMQEKETGLNVFLLDMCRKRNIHDEATPNVVLKVTANIVFGYATCQDAEAFELSSSGFTNGVFIKFLKKRLLEDEKITVMLDRVAEDMGQFDPTKGKQALEIRSSLSERRSLTDPVMPDDCSDVTQARNLLWAKVHELPESMCLEFDCGVQIKLGFAAEFSNVLVIYTSIIKQPEEVASCQAHVTNFSLDLDVDPKLTNRETPEETGSYLLSGSLPQHCLYTRLSSLQKLQEKLVFTVTLQVRFREMEDVVHWNEEVNIGKPLIAKLDLHQTVRRNGCQQTCATPHSPSQSHRPSCNPYLNTHNPPPPGAAGGSENFSSHKNVWNVHVSDKVSMPIETSDNIEELQTDFMNSLQMHGQMD
uniref:Mucosa-associated lymphoid tissue lymphoma translocation protein 1 n=1 Tax=Denticeps clupeoides TaxID=299321 RepID=A0AAY4CDY4_9TELE